jgi:hypothetical protein
MNELSVSGHSTDHIWAMEHDEEIGLRFDCGDSGTLMLSKSQALNVVITLEMMLACRPLWDLVKHWESEAKRCYELAHKRNASKPEQSVMAQSVRFWECARELKECLAGRGESAKDMGLVGESNIPWNKVEGIK